MYLYTVYTAHNNTTKFFPLCIYELFFDTRMLVAGSVRAITVSVTATYVYLCYHHVVGEYNIGTLGTTLQLIVLNY